MSNATSSARTWTVTGCTPRIPRGERRNPLVIVDLLIGREWGATVAVQRKRKGGLALVLPMAADGQPGLTPPRELWDAMAAAALEAVKADAAALAHLATAPQSRRRLGMTTALSMVRPTPDA